jgi:hypothetical protein
MTVSALQRKAPVSKDVCGSGLVNLPWGDEKYLAPK